MRNCIRRDTRLVAALWRVQHGRCFHCNQPMCRFDAPDYDDRRGVTREHVLPKATEGRGKPMNIVLACAECNHRRGHAPLGEAAIGRAREIWARVIAHIPEAWNPSTGVSDKPKRNRKLRIPQYAHMRANLHVTLADIWPA